MRTNLFALLIIGLLLASCGAAGAPPTQTPPSPIAVASPQPTGTLPPTPPPTGTLPPTLTPTPGAGQRLTLAVGQAAQAGSLSLTLQSVDNDSRCPANVACVWEGAIDATIALAIDGQGQGEYRLRLYGKNRATAESQLRIAGQRVRLLAVDPYPGDPTPIPSDGYQATLLIEPDDNRPASPESYIAVGDGSYEGVIVPEQDADGFDMRAEGYWTPSAEQIGSLEAGLADFLRQAAPERSPDLWQKQATYKRQYGGLIQGGRPVIRAHFFCDTNGMDWQHQTIFVLDGGDCYFQLTYDIQRGSYDSLMVNGDA
jgi:hypothetical protein